MTATATCPAGHASSTTDYCDTCGAPIAGAPAAAADPAPAAESANPAAPAQPAEQGEQAGPTPCPGCGEPVLGRFCESCGYNVESGTPAAPASVSLVLGADRAHWERMATGGEPPFPAEVPTLTFALTGDRATLGRVHAGAEPDVDLALTGAAADPGVSHHQCELVRIDADWCVSDTDSANGTWINDADAPLAPGAVHRLAPGDSILIGAWTRLTVQVEPPATPTPTPTPTP